MTKSRRELIVMGALTLERAQKAEQHAATVEKQLAEARMRIAELEQFRCTDLRCPSRMKRGRK